MADKNLNDIYITNIPAVSTTKSGQLRLSTREVEEELIEFFSNPHDHPRQGDQPPRYLHRFHANVETRITQNNSGKLRIHRIQKSFLCLGWSTKAPSYRTKVLRLASHQRYLKYKEYPKQMRHQEKKTNLFHQTS